jgi:hypothetical protein
MLILSTHLGLDLLALSPISYMHSSSPPFVLHALPITSSLIILIILGEDNKIMKLLIKHFSPTFSHLMIIIFWGMTPCGCYKNRRFGGSYRLTSSLFCSNILLNTLFSNTLSLCSSLNVRDQVLHPYRTTGKTIICTP